MIVSPRSAAVAAVCATLIVSAATSLAQQRAATTPVIVVFKDGTPFERFLPNFHADERATAQPREWDYLDRRVVGLVQALEARERFRARHVYTHAVRGFAARLTAQQIAQLQADLNVAYVEPDNVMRIVAQTLPWGVDTVNADLSSTRAGNGSGAITNVNAYVIDTGVDASHPDLNVVAQRNFTDGQTGDCHGHGTHVAGTLAARDNTVTVVGVAPGLRLTAIKVLDCNGEGYTSEVIKGVDWVTANRVRPAVANMSLGGPVSNALDDAVRRSAASGVFYAVGAGNDGVSACYTSPARLGGNRNNGIMTVAAIGRNGEEADWSNYGSCVDVWAPGVSILSTRLSGGTTTMSGTSMASPHAAGAAALYLSTHTGAASSSVESAVRSRVVATGKYSKSGRTVRRIDVSRF